MKHETDIKPSVTRSFNLPFQMFAGKLTAYDWPGAKEWHALPARFLDGIEFASRFVGTYCFTQDQRYVLFVHVSDGKVYATNNQIAVEYDVGGECALDLALTVRQVRAIKAYGASPTHASRRGRHQFKWANGNRFAHRGYSGNGQIIKAQLDRFDWADFHPIDDMWRAQVTGHFHSQSAYVNETLLDVFPDRIATSIYEGPATTDLQIETHAPAMMMFERGVLLKALNVATAVKYIWQGEHPLVLFLGKDVRGAAVGRYAVAS